eukprot:15332849-Ditylum_brightwellii.AAC.1
MECLTQNMIGFLLKDSNKLYDISNYIEEFSADSASLLQPTSPSDEVLMDNLVMVDKEEDVIDITKDVTSNNQINGTLLLGGTSNDSDNGVEIIVTANNTQQEPDETMPTIDDSTTQKASEQSILNCVATEEIANTHIDQEEPQKYAPASDNFLVQKVPLEVTPCKSQEQARTIRFDNVLIRQYDVEVGDNPATTSYGAALTIGWQYKEIEPINVETYEESRESLRYKTLESMRIGWKERQTILLGCGFDLADLQRAH